MPHVSLQFIKQFAAKGNTVVAAVRNSSPELERLSADGKVKVITQLDVESATSIEARDSRHLRSATACNVTSLQGFAEALRGTAGVAHVDVSATTTHR
jgi:NAD(P)-dependent dehydrogenase (short-subunit alcohol dehydrogenase family)